MGEGFSLFNLVETYEGSPVKMLFHGAGFYASRLLEVPGGAKLVDRIQLLSSEQSLRDFLFETLGKTRSTSDLAGDQSHILDNSKLCSYERVVALHACNCVHAPPSFSSLYGPKATPLTVVARITDALPSPEKNEAFIAVGHQNQYEVWHLQLHKLSEKEYKDPQAVEARRFLQDRMVCEVALALVFDTHSDLFAALLSSQFLRKL